MLNDKAILVIGGGPAGLQASKDIAEFGIKVVLVEKNNELGGAPIRWKYHTLAPDFVPTEKVLGPLINYAKNSNLITVYTNSIVESYERKDDNFNVRILNLKNKSIHYEKVNAVIVATGFEHFNAALDPRYGYGVNPNVIGINELEIMISNGKILRHDGKIPKRIGFILCVGSRDKATNQWCCTVCCGVSIKQAIEIKKLIPDSQIYIIYMDIRTIGLWEKLYWESMEEHHINYIRGRVGEIYWTGEKLLVKGEDTLVRGPFEALFDMIVLAVGMEPGEGTKQVAKVFGLNLNQYGFLSPKIPNIHYDSGKDGIFLAGACVAPMSVEEAISEGSAAALQAIKYVMQKSKKVP
jgi:heterodisulfide reductase subunit A